MSLKVSAILFLVLGFAKLVPAAEPYNWSVLWASWNNVTRQAYISGFEHGVAKGFFEVVLALPETKCKNINLSKAMGELHFGHTETTQLPYVITDLYKDPANAFIETADMIFLAIDKIEGKDITNGLMQARAKAIEGSKIIQQLKSDK